MSADPGVSYLAAVAARRGMTPAELTSVLQDVAAHHRAALDAMPPAPAGRCITPGCGDPGRLYPAGWLCGPHAPGGAA